MMHGQIEPGSFDGKIGDLRRRMLEAERRERDISRELERVRKLAKDQGVKL